MGNRAQHDLRCVEIECSIILHDNKRRCLRRVNAGGALFLVKSSVIRLPHDHPTTFGACWPWPFFRVFQKFNMTVHVQNVCPTGDMIKPNVLLESAGIRIYLGLYYVHHERYAALRGVGGGRIINVRYGKTLDAFLEMIIELTVLRGAVGSFAGRAVALPAIRPGVRRGNDRVSSDTVGKGKGCPLSDPFQEAPQFRCRACSAGPSPF